MLIKQYTGLILLFVLIPLTTMGDPVKSILDHFPTRQKQALQEISASVSGATHERCIAMVMLNQRLNWANQQLRTFSSKRSKLIDMSVLLRCLLSFPMENENLQRDTINHLMGEVASFIKENKNSLLTNDPSRTITESREIVKHSFLCLWANYVKDASPDYQWPDQKSNDDHIRNHSSRINHWLDQRGLYGFEERSSVYYAHDLAALLLLRDFCQDDKIQTKSDAIIDQMVTDIAQESIGGYWGGARCRSFEALTPLEDSRLHYILFGTTKLDPLQSIQPLTFHLAGTDYLPPPVLVRLGTDGQNRGIYDITNRFCMDRRYPEQAGVGRKYTYVTPNYILGSFQLRDQRIPWQTRPWDLLICDQEGNSYRLFTFNGDQLYSGGTPPFEKEFYLWNATSFQHKNVLFCQFHRSDRKRQGVASLNKKVDHRLVQLPTRVWIPEDLGPLTNENNWWFAEVGNVYLAFRPLTGRSYWWRSAHMRASSGINASLLSFQDLDSAFLLEIEEKANFASFAHFKQQVSESPLEIGEDWATFVSRRGDVFLFSLTGDDFMVNGETVNPWNDESYLLYSSPYTYSEYGSGIFTVEWCPYTLNIDLSNPESPKRVITTCK